MAIDQPTTPNLGNLTDAQFRSLPDWSVPATNQVGKDDTFAAMEECVVALFYRLMKENMAYINLALAGEVDTPLLLFIQSLLEKANWRETDWPAVGLTLTNLSGITPLPSAFWSCNGERTDVVNGTLELVSVLEGLGIQYSVVSAQGSRPLSEASSFVLGIRTHALRHIYVDDTPLARQENIAYQASYSLPEWPQDNLKPIVLAKVADRFNNIDTGALFRVGFEFGLGGPGTGDEGGDVRDYILYLKWYSSDDAARYVYAQIGPPDYPAPEFVGITPGRRTTLGFHRYQDSGSNNWRVRFYVNGRMLVDMELVGGAAVGPSPGTSSSVRLNIGSAQLGESYCGGPINNVALWANAGEATLDAAMLATYQRGEGFQAAP